MGQPKHPLSYPTQFFELARAAAVRPVRLEFSSPGRAHAFVLKWGAFRRSLQRNPEIDPELAALSMALPAFKEKGGLAVTIKQADYFAKEIDDALGLTPTPGDRSNGNKP